MLFKTTSSELLSAIQKVIPAVPKKSMKAAYEHFKFIAGDGYVSIVGNDGDISISGSFSANVEVSGEVLIPAYKFYDIIRAIGAGSDIQISVNMDNFAIEIKAKTGKYSMKGLPSDDYIEFDDMSDVKGEALEFTLTRDEANLIANHTLFAVSNDEFRLAMTGVLIQLRGDYLNAVSTDSYRLSKLTLKAVSIEDRQFPNDVNIVIPSKTMELIKKSNADIAVAILSNAWEPKYVYLAIGEDLAITSRLIDARFPPYETIIPEFFQKSICANRKEFTSALKRVSIFSGEDSKQVRMKINSNSLEISATDEANFGKAKETIPCDFSGEPTEIGFNVKYLEDSLEHLGSNTDNFYILLNSEIAPVIVSDYAELSDKLLLNMPLRLAKGA